MHAKMKLLIIVAALLLVGAGTAAAATVYRYEDPKRIFQSNVTRYVDEENGVVCYIAYGSRGISCLQTR